MNDTILRSASIDDAPGIAQVQVQSWDETYRGILPDSFIESRTYEGRLNLWTRILTHDHFFTEVIELNGQIVGFVNGGPTRNTGQAGDGEVYALYVLRSVQKRGLGRTLFDAARRTLQTMGYQSFVLTVLKDNPTTAFYERMGGDHLSDEQLSIDGAQFEEVVYRFTV